LRPRRYCKGTEKLPPPIGYFAANPQPIKTGGSGVLVDLRKDILKSILGFF
jgi:hypothetical protein